MRPGIASIFSDKVARIMLMKSVLGLTLSVSRRSRVLRTSARGMEVRSKINAGHLSISLALGGEIVCRGNPVVSKVEMPSALMGSCSME